MNYPRLMGFLWSIVGKKGRRTKYQGEATCEKCRLLCLKGATDEMLALALDIEPSTLYKWKLDFPEFSEALKGAKTDYDAQVEEALFKRALGYSHPAVKIFCDKDGCVTEAPYTERFPPDATSMIFWLKNRQPARWREKQEVEHSGELKLTPALEIYDPKER